MVTLWAAEASLFVGIDNRGNIVTSVSIMLLRFYNNDFIGSSSRLTTGTFLFGLEQFDRRLK